MSFVAIQASNMAIQTSHMAVMMDDGVEVDCPAFMQGFTDAGANEESKRIYAECVMNSQEPSREFFTAPFFEWFGVISVVMLIIIYSRKGDSLNGFDKVFLSAVSIVTTFLFVFIAQMAFIEFYPSYDLESPVVLIQRFISP